MSFSVKYCMLKTFNQQFRLPNIWFDFFLSLPFTAVMCVDTKNNEQQRNRLDMTVSSDYT